jgi:hypothetical protein
MHTRIETRSLLWSRCPEGSSNRTSCSDDLLAYCKLHAPVGEIFASPVREMSLLFWMIFAHHRKLRELEKRLGEELAALHKTLEDYAR